MDEYSIKPTSKDSVKICCGGRGCPEVRDLGNGTYEITDDNGNKVVLKKEEATLIGDAVKVVSDKQRLILG
jgi:hypothetical protein